MEKQIFISCGQDEPYGSPTKAYFSHVIGVYILSFINEHPVVYNHILSHKYNVVNHLVLSDLSLNLFTEIESQ